MKKLVEFLQSITAENNQFCESKGYVPRFLDIGIKIQQLSSLIISQALTRGICRIHHKLNYTEDITELLTYLFYDIIRLDDTNSFQGANQKIVNSPSDSYIDSGLFNFLINSDETWIRVHPEYYDHDPSMYDCCDFPSKGSTIIGYDSNENSYPVMTGKLWFILTNSFGTKEACNSPDLIIPSKFITKYASSWKVNHEMSIHCMAASHRNSGVFLDFESGINKLSPFNFNLLSRNDLTAAGSISFKKWSMIIPETCSKTYDSIAEKCCFVIKQDLAMQLYTAKNRLQWFCELLLQ